MKNAKRMTERKTIGQTMIELAVFGSVLFFLIGGIASNYLSGSFQQNAQLQAMRKALFKSYQSSQAATNERVSASLLMFEDRLTGDFGKFGTLDRQPVAASGGGMLNAYVMQPVEWREPNSLPLMDVSVNGQEFVFRTSAFVEYVVLLAANATDGEDVQIIQLQPLSSLNIKEEVVEGPWVCTTRTDPNKEIDCTDDGIKCPKGGQCKPKITTTVLTETASLFETMRMCMTNPTATNTKLAAKCKVAMAEGQGERMAREWVATADPVTGMPSLCYAMTSTNLDFNNWKLFGNSNAEDIISAQQKAVQKEGEAEKAVENTGGFVEEAAFNLLRDGIKDSTIPEGERGNAAWRWSWNKFEDVVTRVDKDNDSSPSYDVDGDLQEETIYEIKDISKDTCKLHAMCIAAYQVKVQDSAVADVDPSKGPADFKEPKEKPGIRPEFRIFSRTGCVELEGGASCEGRDSGTYLDVQEGKLFKDGQPVSMSTLKKNQYDIVERIYQLNINMADPDGFVKMNSASIKAVGKCNSAAHMQETCFDKDTKTLYIRSRLSDQRGHRWTTSTKQTWDESLGIK